MLSKHFKKTAAMSIALMLSCIIVSHSKPAIVSADISSQSVLLKEGYENIESTSSYLLNKSNSSNGITEDINGDGIVNIADLCLSKSKYEKTGDNTDLFIEFKQDSGKRFLTVSSGESEKCNRVIVQATENYDFTKFNPVSVLCKSDFYYLLQFDTIENAEKCIDKLNGHSNIKYAVMDGRLEAELDYIVYIDSDSLPSNEPTKTPIPTQSPTRPPRPSLNPPSPIPTLRPTACPLSWGAIEIGAYEYAKYLRSMQLHYDYYTKPISIAVIDTGFKTEHELLRNKLDLSNGINLGFTQPNIIDQSDLTDYSGHGTHVAGTIADCTKSLPNIKIIPIKVSDYDGYISDTNMVAAIEYAIKINADIINISIGPVKSRTSCKWDSTIDEAVDAGITVVKSAGNENSDTIYYAPAGNKKCIVVSSVEKNENGALSKAADSNYGSSVDFCAPGVKIKSSTYDGEYGLKSGTSMATPHITAAAAMIKAHFDNSNIEIEEKLKSICVDLGESGKDKYYGWGIPNLTKLIEAPFTTHKLCENSECSELIPKSSNNIYCESHRKNDLDKYGVEYYLAKLAEYLREHPQYDLESFDYDDFYEFAYNTSN